MVKAQRPVSDEARRGKLRGQDVAFGRVERMIAKVTGFQPPFEHCSIGPRIADVAHIMALRKNSVTIISENPETVDGLHSYLSGAGVTSNARRTLLDARTLPSSSSAVVLFPDEFSIEAVLKTIADLRGARPKVLILMVTATPQRFGKALATDGRSLPPIVLPKPAFGWTILDAIRAHVGSCTGAP